MPTFADQVRDNQIRLLVGVAVLLPKAGPPPSFQALVDTVAQKTMVSPKVVEQTGAIRTDIASFVPANGKPQETDEFLLNISIPIATGPQSSRTTYSSGRDLTVLLLPYSPPGFDVLLGLDFLRPYHITMWNGTFVLSN